MPNRTKIDEIDAKILKTLLRDSRTSFTKMAEECKITVGAVRMRYKRLWKDGVINGEITLVNPHALGYDYAVDLGIVTNVENEKEVSEYLKNKQYKHMAVVGPFGRYNVFAVAVFHNIQELAEIIQDVKSHPKVKHVEELIWAEAVHMEHMENLIFEPLSEIHDSIEHPIPPIINREKAKMDQTDKQIAKILTLNARTPFKKIAEKLGISTKNVIQRYKKLKQTVLSTSTITVDLKKLGFQAFAFFFIKVNNRSKIPEIYSKLLDIPNVVVAFKTLGPYDLHGTIFLTSFDKLFEKTAQMRRIPGIDSAEIHIAPAWETWPPSLFSTLLD
ncbi:MAG TPA: Lrp/AsnC family transcriptional regulator [Candidatus Bathyarchaeia archaeon]